MLGLLLAQSNVLGDLQLGSHWHTDNTGRRYSGPFSASNGHCVGRLQAGLTGNQLGNRCAVVADFFSGCSLQPCLQPVTWLVTLPCNFRKSVRKNANLSARLLTALPLVKPAVSVRTCFQKRF